MSRLVSKREPNIDVLSGPTEGLLIDVLDVLESLWGQEAVPKVSAFDDPLDGLILTVLSQNTNDNNRDRAFDKLKSLYPTWDQVAALPSEVLADAIRVAGIANVKSTRIKEILEVVRQAFGSYSLKGMSSWEGGAVMEFMLSLPGVGPKTAACVMVFDLGLPAFPVDTHVARFCRRMGWVDRSASPVSIQEQMETLVPEGRKKGAHLNIISHCKAICRARNPLCGSCPLSDICPSVVLN